jgi:O-antigen/teichoic acid export membrane protein
MGVSVSFNPGSVAKTFTQKAVFLLAANTLANFLAFLFQLVAVRRLDHAAFGVFNVLLVLLSIVNIPLYSFQTYVSNISSWILARNRQDELGSFFFSALRVIAGAALVITGIIVLLSPFCARFLKIPAYTDLWIFAATIFSYFLLSVAHGTIQGTGKLTALGISAILNAGLRLLLAIGFFLFLIPTVGLVMVSYGLANVVAFSFLVFVLRASLKGSVQAGWLHAKISDAALLRRHFIFNTLGFISLMVLASVDMIAVKHYFEPVTAGEYAVAQLAGKIVFFLASAVTLATLPAVAQLTAVGHESRVILKKSLLYVGILSWGAALIFAAFPRVFLSLLTGRDHLGLEPLVQILSISMAVYSLNNVFFYYFLGSDRLKYMFVFCSGAITLIAAMWRIHSSPVHIALVSLSVGIVVLLGNFYLAFFHED